MKKRHWGTLAVLIMLFALAFSFQNTASNGAYAGFPTSASTVEQYTFTEFTSAVESDDVATANIELNENMGIATVTGELKDKDANGAPIYYTVMVPSYTAASQTLLLEHDVNVTYTSVPAFTLGTILLSFLPLAIIIGFFIFMMKRAGGGAGGQDPFSFSKSKARLQVGGEVKFSDVAGYKEEKIELAEIVDFLKDPSKYNEIGARIPKGVLLVGPPGTGKTLLARATAGEAGVPFFSISGSEFLEMFVGVGAARVRDMFKNAKEKAPGIIFIDEIDAIGRQRGAGMGGGNDEREQTLNQILVELDGFEGNSGLILMAATNRPDVLDPALVRPGRFDRTITINNPNSEDRRKILDVHARNKKMAADADLDHIARSTTGFSGAELANLLNEAALIATRHGKKEIGSIELDEALDRVIAGPAKPDKNRDREDTRRVAYHEAGHALIGMLLNQSDYVQKVTIVPRGFAGGYAIMLPKKEKMIQTKQDLQDKITGIMGGRIAEEIIFNDLSTGASNDIEQATKIARAMVTEYGMSNLGPVQYEKNSGSVFLGRDYTKSQMHSESMAMQIDQEVRIIIEDAYKRGYEFLEGSKELLERLAEALLEKETLLASDIEKLFEGYDINKPDQLIVSNDETSPENDAELAEKEEVISESKENSKEEAEIVEEESHNNPEELQNQEIENSEDTQSPENENSKEATEK